MEYFSTPLNQQSVAEKLKKIKKKMISERRKYKGKINVDFVKGKLQSKEEG